MVDFSEIINAIQTGNAKKSESLTVEYLNNKVSAKDILNNGLIKAMEIVGEKFKNNEFYVPEVLVAARAMKKSINILRPILAQTGVESAGKILIGTVEGDLHDIGKNLVHMMFEGAGFEIIDLGTDVPPEKFVKVAKEEKPDILGMSALLTTTMTSMQKTIDLLEREGLRNEIFIMIGGAPVTESYVKEIGADGYATDASSAVEIAKKHLNQKD